MTLGKVGAGGGVVCVVPYGRMASHSLSRVLVIKLGWQMPIFLFQLLS